MGFNFRRWQFVPNGVDTAMFHPDPNGSARLKTALGLMPNDLIVGSVGRFHPQKDYPTLLRALAMVMRTDPRVHAVIVGSSLDSANRALTKLATLLRIRERIHLLGPRSDTQSILAGFDLFVLASAFGEACPTVLVEAMACGVPCVATDIGDSAQIIGDTGKIVAARDPSALAAACSEMLADRSASSREAARQRVLEGYSLERMTKGYADVFESLINKRSEAADGSGSHVSCSAKPRTDRGGSASPDDQIDSHS
jgi:glycosyltransferase involved in cell wall biosynthesis